MVATHACCTSIEHLPGPGSLICGNTWVYLLRAMRALLAERTKNFSGAEIEGLVKSAASFALNRQVDVNDLDKPVIEENIKVGLYRVPFDVKM